MHQSDSKARVTPYQLATLASRIYHESCASNPKEAIAAADRLLNEAIYACAHAEAEDRKNEEETAAWDKEVSEARVDWLLGIKQITGERRRDRATKRFAAFMEHKASGKDFRHYKRDGFTVEELFELQHEFTNWKKQPKRKKGKQGRRISEDDGRLRTDLVRLVPTKPRKRA